MQAIAGTMHPDDGRIIIDGQAVYDSAQQLDLSPQVRRVGYVPQHYALFPHLTAAGDRASVCWHLSQLWSKQRKVSERYGALFGLARIGTSPTAELSGGQTATSRTWRGRLAVQPRLLLLDEPFAALDVRCANRYGKNCLQVQARIGITVLIVTHDLTDAFALGQRMIVYDAGRVIQQGTRGRGVLSSGDTPCSRVCWYREYASGCS